MIHVSGRVIDAQTREPLLFANVFQTNEQGKFTAGNPGTITNQNGTYFFNAEGYLTASYVGYKPQTKPVAHTTHFELLSDNTLPEVEVIAQRIKKQKPFLTLIFILGLLFFIYYKIKK